MCYYIHVCAVFLSVRLFPFIILFYYYYYFFFVDDDYYLLLSSSSHLSLSVLLRCYYDIVLHFILFY